MTNSVQTKACSKCKRVKPAQSFPIDHSMKCGLYSHCKDCVNAAGKLKYLDPVKRVSRLKHLANYKKRFPERIKAAQARFRKKNAEKIRVQNQEYHQRPEVKERLRLWSRQYRKNPIKRLVANCRLRFRVLKQKSFKNSGRTFRLLGITSIDTLRDHLESRFTKGMTWENYGQWGWQMDHIKPISHFNVMDESEAQKAFHYTNLQPLWWWDNYSKGNRRQS